MSKRNGWARRWLTLIGLLIVLSAVVSLGEHTQHQSSPSSQNALPTGSAPAGSLSLITEPDDGLSPEINLMHNAHTSIDLVMYELEDQTVEQALLAAQNREVTIRVLLNQGYYGQQSGANKAAYQFLQQNHIPVRWTPRYFALTHQKTLIVDGATASIMTFNFTPQYYVSSRDFAVNDTDARDVQAIEQAFNADWDAHKISAAAGDDLVWSPGSEQAMLALINGAVHSLQIYNEEMADSRITTALEAAAKRGVHVQVDMTYSSSWRSAFAALTQAGVEVRTYAANAPRYIHAKMIIADDQRAFVGSENFSLSSLDNNRELGILLSDQHIVGQLTTTFATDWQAASSYH